MVVVHNISINVLGKYIHLGCRKLASADSLLKQDVHLSKGPPRWLGHAEICVNDAEETDASLEHLVVSGCRTEQGRP